MSRTRARHVITIGAAVAIAIAVAAPSRGAQGGPPTITSPYLFTETIYRPECPKDGGDELRESCHPGM
jgi:hypothetical protein